MARINKEDGYKDGKEDGYNLGRLESQVGSMYNSIIEIRQDVSNLEECIQDLQKWQYRVIGIASTIGAALTISLTILMNVLLKYLSSGK